MVGERRKKMKNPLGLISVPSVIDTTNPYPVLSYRNNLASRRVVT